MLSATARVPIVPLDITYVDQAVAKELILDYSNGNIYVSKTDGSVLDITESITQKVVEEGIDASDIKIEIEGTEYTIEGAIEDIIADINNIKEIIDGESGNISANVITETENKKFVSASEKTDISTIDDINEALGRTVDSETGAVSFTELEKVDKINDSIDELVVNINTDDIEETNTRQFISAAEKEKVNSNFEEFENIQNALGYTEDPQTGEGSYTAIEKVNRIVEEIDELTYNLSVDDIQETSAKQFISAAEKAKAIAATHFETLTSTILGGSEHWTGEEAPYTQRITVENALETDIPIIDISLGNDLSVIRNQLDNYSYIYKIMVYDGYIDVYAMQPTEVDITITMKVDR